jgi:hypothetical protein
MSKTLRLLRGSRKGGEQRSVRRGHGREEGLSRWGHGLLELPNYTNSSTNYANPLLAARTLLAQ